jgi:hypothetical protein
MNDLIRMVASSRPARLDENEDTRPDPASIMAHPQRPVARPASRRRLVVATALAVAGAVIVGGISARTKEPGSTPPATGTTTGTPAPATARALLLAAAEQTTQDSSNGRYWRIAIEQGERLEVGPASRPYAILRKVSEERWLPTGQQAAGAVAARMLGARPVGAADEAAWKADGSPRQWRQGDVVITMAGGPRGVKTAPAGAAGLWLAGAPVTMKQLAALPSDPAALRKWLLARLDTAAEGPADYLLFVAGQALVTELPVRPAVRAATYRMLADLPGVRLFGAVLDQHGRAGTAVGYLRNGSETRLIVDGADGQALAQESWHGDTLLSYQVFESTGYTNEAPPTR